MIKKFIIAFMFALITISYINVKADTDYSTHINNWNIQFKPLYDSSKLYYVADVQEKITTKYTDCIGVVVVAEKPNIGTNVNYYTITSSDLVNGNLFIANAKYINSSYSDLMCMHLNNRNGYAFQIEYSQGNWKVGNKSTIQTQILNNNNYVNNNIRYDTFYYNNLTDVYIYIFDTSVKVYYNNVRQNLPTFIIGEDIRDNVIGGFDPNMYPYNSFAYGKDGELYVRVTETYEWDDTTSDNHHLFTFNLSIPSNTALNTYWNEYFSETDINATILSLPCKDLISKNSNAVYNADGTKKSSSDYVSFNFTVDMEYALYQGYCTINVNEEAGQYDKVGFLYKDYEWTSQYLSGLTYNPKGILNSMVNYYNSVSKALFALCYINYNYITCNSYDPSTKTVYNPMNIYYPDARYANGVVAERRNLSNKTNVSTDDVYYDPTNSDNITGEEETPLVKPSDNTLQDLYNNSIQNSYNNITNNYYYDNGLTENILDYYRGFSDGATDENIDSALGYVKGTLGSLTHIPLLLSYCFNAFFPIEIIRLFQALLIIFVVFMIIRIIKHLFTH